MSAQAAAPLTADDARRVLDLDIETGVLRWKQRPVRPGSERVDRIRNTRTAGRIAGYPHNAGYLRVGIEGAEYLAHRVVWLIVHGHWPEGEIDHRDGDRRNNRPTNLRLATRLQNARNTAIHPTNQTGLKGVRRRLTAAGFRYGADICVNRKILWLGTFDTAAEAHAAYEAAAREHFGDFARIAA